MAPAGAGAADPDSLNPFVAFSLEVKPEFYFQNRWSFSVFLRPSLHASVFV